jgi:hypothetical protein
MVAHAMARMMELPGTDFGPGAIGSPGWFRVEPLRQVLGVLGIDAGRSRVVSLSFGHYKRFSPHRDAGKHAARLVEYRSSLLSEVDEEWMAEIPVQDRRTSDDAALPNGLLAGCLRGSVVLRQLQLCLSKKRGRKIVGMYLVPKDAEVSVGDRSVPTPDALASTGFWPCWNFKIRSRRALQVVDWIPLPEVAYDQMLNGVISAGSLGLLAMATSCNEAIGRPAEKLSPITGFTVRWPGLGRGNAERFWTCNLTIGAEPSYGTPFWSSLLAVLEKQLDTELRTDFTSREIVLRVPR